MSIEFRGSLKGKQVKDRIRCSDGWGTDYDDEIVEIQVIYKTKEGEIYYENGEIVDIRQISQRYVLKESKEDSNRSFNINTKMSNCV